MKLLLVICSFLVVAVAQEEGLSCSYRSWIDGNYECDIRINNPDGWNNFTEIEGNHSPGFTDADVKTIRSFSGTSTNVPQIICETFPNITQFDFSNLGITEIDDSAFGGCSSITRLTLNFNRINSISENAFVTLRSVETIDLTQNQLATLPENVFANQQKLTNLVLTFNLFDDFPDNLFRPLENLQSLSLSFMKLAQLNRQWFTENSRLTHLTLGGNEISEIPPGTFAQLPNLQVLHLFGNNLNVLGADSFSGLGQLAILDIGQNPIAEVDDEAFRGLENLTQLDISFCGLRELNFNSLRNLVNLTRINLELNVFEVLPQDAFAPLSNLNFISLRNNRLHTLRRNTFGDLTELRTLQVDRNGIIAIDRAIIDDAVNLDNLFFDFNQCAWGDFRDFQLNRPEFLPMLETCFTNIRYIVDTTTENDGVYAVFEAPQRGIALRVQSDNQIQIAFSQFGFLGTPLVEIFIGSANNTQSVIRINGEIDVVTVETPNIIQQNQSNDFRVSWADQNVYVFSGSESWPPFLSYAMQEFFPVNFYGLRAVETVATWSVRASN